MVKSKGWILRSMQLLGGPNPLAKFHFRRRVESDLPLCYRWQDFEFFGRVDISEIDHGASYDLLLDEHDDYACKGFELA